MHKGTFTSGDDVYGVVTSVAQLPFIGSMIINSDCLWGVIMLCFARSLQKWLVSLKE